jgi:hypothetical protein
MSPITYSDHQHGIDVALDDLKIDLAAQRALVGSRVRKLSAKFDPVLVGELLVSKRPDGHYVVDGHHRLAAAAAQNGNTPTSLKCEVFTGLHLADEARLFMGRNDRANVRRLDFDRNLATSGDQDTLDIQMAAQSAGFVFVTQNEDESTFRDRAAGVMIMRDAERRKHIDLSGPEHLARVFAFYARTYGNQERIESIVFKALSKVFLLKTPVNEDRLYERLHGLPPQQILALAVIRKSELAAIRGITTVTAAVEVLAEQYNRGFTGDSDKRIRV